MAVKNIRDYCDKCGFNMMGEKADLYADCMESNCKILAKAMQNLKPYYDAKLKMEQYDREHPEGVEIKEANRKRRSKVVGPITAPFVPIKEHLENLEKMTLAEIVAYHSKKTDGVVRVDIGLMEAEYSMYQSSMIENGKEPDSFRVWFSKQEVAQ